MATTQSVVTPPSRAAVFLVATIGSPGARAVRDGLQGLAGLVRSVGFRAPHDALTCVVGISHSGWSRLFEGTVAPRELHPFPCLQGRRHRAPATPGDLLFHVRAQRMDLCFELARLIKEQLGDAVSIVDEVHGFSYFDARDLLGFVDGTASPTGAAGAEAAFVGDEDPEFRGGSYVIVQKYLHDMTAWESLTTEEQERVMGRTKLSDIELPDEIKPANSHVALNTVVEDGVERDIVRENMPFGNVGQGEFGTYFIGYARTPAVTERMLRNMFIGDPPGNTDRILDFSTAVTGGLFFVPSADFLDDLKPAGADAAAGGGDSLSIGSLKGN